LKAVYKLVYHGHVPNGFTVHADVKAAALQSSSAATQQCSNAAAQHSSSAAKKQRSKATAQKRSSAAKQQRSKVAAQQSNSAATQQWKFALGGKWDGKCGVPVRVNLAFSNAR
jgi:hypothetical protein